LNVSFVFPYKGLIMHLVFAVMNLNMMQVSIRIETLHKLAGVYRSYCTKFFEGFEAGHDQFEWIPSQIFHSCCGKGSADFM
jgi:hypothetical protein